VAVYGRRQYCFGGVSAGEITLAADSVCQSVNRVFPLTFTLEPVPPETPDDPPDLERRVGYGVIGSETALRGTVTARPATPIFGDLLPNLLPKSCRLS